MVYDRTCRGRYGVGLTHSWIAGAALYKGLGRFDAAAAASSWAEALAFLQSFSAPIREIQYWGHGKWGRALIDRDVLDESALSPGHPHYDALARVRDRLVQGDSLIWFRTCETFGKEVGHSFATSLSRFTGGRVAGHTYVIGPFQSGLHSLRPGQAPGWSTTEGLDPQNERAGLMSTPWAPNTITCLHGRIPEGF